MIVLWSGVLLVGVALRSRERHRAAVESGAGVSAALRATRRSRALTALYRGG